MKLMHAEKHLGVQLDNKLSFNKHTNNKITKAAKYIGLLPKLAPTVQRIIFKQN